MRVTSAERNSETNDITMTGIEASGESVEVVIDASGDSAIPYAFGPVVEDHVRAVTVDGKITVAPDHSTMHVVEAATE